MRHESDGSILFDCGKNVFKFEADNYKKHVSYHKEIATPQGLASIELTLKDPHCITITPNNGRARYRVFKKIKQKGDRFFVIYWKVISFESKQPYLRSIATAFSDSSYNDKIVNKLEKIIWKKRVSST
ncbi:MAG: hypothetical protein HYT65_02655 [Candidatus Yanofskybacteria bacterium]|nr:hypothetical protein [Candidatus Yanofskybacteria bacterium]